MINSKPVKVLIFSPSAYGGIAEYSFYQASELKKAGAKVVCLVSPDFLQGRATDFEKVICLADSIPEGGSRLARKIRMAWQIVFNRLILAGQIIKHRPHLVLLDSYVEYFSPLWVWPHWILARLGKVCYAANLHDPVRSYAIGPDWWHSASVRLAYLPLDFVLVHETPREPSPVPSKVRVVQVPHGLYEISGTAPDRAIVRREWGVRDGQKVFLAFGYIRDGKNLDLSVRALVKFSEAFLVMAGSVASTNDKPFAFYRDLADRLGVADRCRFFEGFVNDNDLGKYFAGADFVILTYAATFHSQSGVLNIAARARKPVLASASPSALIQSVNQFALGVAIIPDSLEAVIEGMRNLLQTPPQPRWQEYEEASAWSKNAVGILAAAGLTLETTESAS